MARHALTFTSASIRVGDGEWLPIEVTPVTLTYDNDDSTAQPYYSSAEEEEYTRSITNSLQASIIVETLTEQWNKPFMAELAGPAAGMFGAFTQWLVSRLGWGYARAVIDTATAQLGDDYATGRNARRDDYPYRLSRSSVGRSHTNEPS